MPRFGAFFCMRRYRSNFAGSFSRGRAFNSSGVYFGRCRCPHKPGISLGLQIKMPFKAFLLSASLRHKECPGLGLFFVCGDTVQTSQARFHGAELSIHPGFISDAVAVLISPGYHYSIVYLIVFSLCSILFYTLKQIIMLYQLLFSFVLQSFLNHLLFFRY